MEVAADSEIELFSAEVAADSCVIVNVDPKSAGTSGSSRCRAL